jgi:uncharacterized protein YjiS (DUF1127 family)
MSTFTSTVSGGLRRIAERSSRAARMRREYRLLMAMSDHELRDIGVTREQVPGLFGR